MQVSLSICLIIKNEEKYLRRCLSSIKDIASQIIVVDTGSTDDSIQIASEFSEQIYSYKWQDDFSSARNFCLDRADGEWILVLDGDEELDVKSLEPLLEKIQVLEVEAYLLSVKHYSSKVHELLDIPDFQPRLFRNNKSYRYRGVIHEKILDSIQGSNPSARVELAREISIMHYGYAETDIENRYRLKRKRDLINRKFFREEEEGTKRFYLGQENYNHNKFEQALEHFIFVYEHPNEWQSFIPELFRYIALSLFLLDRSSEALAFVDNALKRMPDNGDLCYIKAVIYKNNSQYDLAYRAYQECLKFSTQLFYFKSFSSQNIPKIYFCLGGLAEFFMDKEKALFFFLESLKHDPYLLDSLRRIVTILDPRINPEYTIECLNKVFDLNDWPLQAALAAMFYEKGAYQLALEIIRQLESSGPLTEKIRLLKGLCLLRSKQYSYAEEELQIIKNDVSLHIKAQLYLLLYYLIMHAHYKVLGCLRRIIIAGADPTALHVLNLLTKGHSRKTLKSAKQGYLLTEEIIDLLVELGESSQVDEAFQNLIPITGNRPSRLLAEILFKYEKYDLAQKEFRCLLEIDNADAQIYYYMSKICWAQGDLYSAVTFLNQTIKTGLDTPKIRWEVARLHQELAIANLREGLKHCPNNQERQELLGELEESLLDI